MSQAGAALARSIRIIIDAAATRSASGKLTVTAAKLRLAACGAGATRAQRHSPQPARISFFIRRFRGIRTEDVVGPELLATLDGQILLTGANLDPVFVLDPAADPAIVHASLDPSSRCLLPLTFDPESFDLTGTFASKPKLILPGDTNDFRFLEVDTTLDIAGGSEAALGVSDPLDVPLPIPLPTHYEVELLDDLDQPLSNIPLVFSTDTETIDTVTDGSGAAVVDVQPALTVRVSANGAALQQAFANRDPRQARSKEFPTASEATMVTMRQLQAGIDLAETQQKIVVVGIARLVHGVRATGWDGLALAQPGPFALDQTVLTTVSMVADGTGAQLTLQKQIEKDGGTATWLSAVPDTLAALLCAGDFTSLFGLLAAVPLAPAASPPPGLVAESSTVSVPEPASPGPDDPAKGARA